MHGRAASLAARLAVSLAALTDGRAARPAARVSRAEDDSFSVAGVAKSSYEFYLTEHNKAGAICVTSWF